MNRNTFNVDFEKGEEIQTLTISRESKNIFFELEAKKDRGPVKGVIPWRDVSSFKVLIEKSGNRFVLRKSNNTELKFGFITDECWLRLKQEFKDAFVFER